MATLVSKTSGDFTSSTTFAVAETGALALKYNLANNIQKGAADTTSSVTFTITNGSVIDGVVLWIKNDTTTPTGTFTIALRKAGITQASVTVNKTDIPSALYNIARMPPTFFKFTSTVVGDGAADWTLTMITTGSQSLWYHTASAPAADFSRILRTTTTAAPAAADNFFVVGELTGAGTHNSFTVTMDSTVATAYCSGTVFTNGSGVNVSTYGTLSYGTNASTNYILRINSDLVVHSGGTLNIGSPGAEIPRNSTAVLEFQPVSADGDFGLRCFEYSTVNIAGLSRTVGKNIVKCKLTSDLAYANVITSISATNGTQNPGVNLESTGNSLHAVAGWIDNVTSGPHCLAFVAPNLAGNTVRTATVWLARGTGTNNRYVRVVLGNTGNPTTVTSGLYADIDLQLGTAGTVTAIGTGTATSVSITPAGRGYVVRLVGTVTNTVTSVANVLTLCACSAAATVSYVGNTTQCFIADRMSIIVASSITDITFNVDADTGWLAEDAVCVASTSRSYGECELFPLNANAGASSFTSAVHPFGGTTNATHSGTAPVQAEIGLLTRNVKIRSTSPTLMTYTYFAATATVNVSWAEFYYISANTVNKYGIAIDTGAVANPKSFTYCSIHDADATPVVMCNNGANVSLNVTFSNNVLWNNGAGYFVYVNAAVTNSDYILSDNLVMRANANNGGGFWIADVGGVITNNTAVGSTGTGSHGFTFNEANGVIGTFTGNVSRAQGGWGLLNNSNVTTTGLVDDFQTWRNVTGGIHTNGGDITNLRFNDIVAAGSPTNFFLQTAANKLTITGNSVIASEASYTSTYGIVLAYNTLTGFDVTNVDFTGYSIGITPTVSHTTSDIAFITATSFAVYGWFNNCKFGTTVINGKTAWTDASYLGFQRYNQIDGDHRTHLKYGLLQTDAVTYHTDTPAMKMTPTSSTAKLESSPDGFGLIVPVNSGAAITASVWVRKDPYYFGNQPRMMVRSNPALGVSTDTVLATCSDVTSSSTPTVFNLTSPGLVLSNGNLTVSRGTATFNTTARPIAPRSTGQYYFEVVPLVNTNLNAGVGILSYPDGAHFAAIAYAAGLMFVDGVNSGSSGGVLGAGYYVGVAVDLTARLIWFRNALNVSGILPGNWNNNASANPVTGVGGLAIFPGVDFVPYVTFAGSNLGEGYTANFGQNTFRYPLPTGFGSWNQTPYAGTDTWVQISGTAPVATDVGAMEFFVDCDNLITTGYTDIDDWAFTNVGSPVGGLKYWFDGAPVSAFGPSGDGLKYWFNGLPVIGGFAGGGGFFWAGII